MQTTMMPYGTSESQCAGNDPGYPDDTAIFLKRFAPRGRDPAQADENLYRYCGDEPTDETDPSGLIKWDSARANALGQWQVQTDAGNWIDVTLDPDGYNCHSFTFGGDKARAGKFWISPSVVPTILKDDGWKRIPSFAAGGGDIIVWYNWRTGVADHSGKLDSLALLPFETEIDPNRTIVTAKHGAASLVTDTLQAEQDEYGGFYSCYTKGPKEGGTFGCLGVNERGKDQKAPELRRPREE